MWRVAVVYMTILIMALSIIGRIIYLQFFSITELREISEKMTIRNRVIEASRGDICTEDGHLIATSVPYYEIRVDMLSSGITEKLLYEKIDSLSLCLANLFKDKSKEEYKNILLTARKKGNRYLLLKRKANYDQLKALKSYPIFRQGKYKGGLIAIRDYKRVHPYGNIAGRTIGYVSKDIVANAVGIEGSFDHFLKGTEGYRLMRRIADNVWVPVNDRNEVEPKDGMDIITTIDIRLQDVAENALYKQLQKHEAHHGTAVLMEVETGKIRAIANLERDVNGTYKESYNYAIGESTEPGSTFKLPALLVAIEDGYIQLSDTIDTGNGKIKFYNQTVSDTKHGGYGRISVQQIFELSSNVGVSKIINHYYKSKPHRFIDRLYSMHLNEPSGIEIRGETRPHIKYPGDLLWSGVSLPMISFGYEVQMTPLQILTFYNAIANGGKMVKPMLIKEIRFHGQTVRKYDTKVINPAICSKLTITQAKKMLEGVVERGTATNLKNNNYRIAGKTGTAQLANNKYGYKQASGISYQASFVGYFPADNPKYSCIVVVNAPSRNVYYGNVVAGPVFKEIADKVYATSPELHKLIEDRGKNKPVNVPFIKPGFSAEICAALKNLYIRYEENDTYSNIPVVVERKEKSVALHAMKTTGASLIPNVKGMGIKDALFILENAGMEVHFTGRGVVIAQSPEAGTKVEKAKKILLTMSAEI